MKIIAILLLAATLRAQDWPTVERQVQAETRSETRWRTMFWTSVGTMLASTGADAYTSYGKIETNPLLANSQHRFALRGELLKACFAGMMLSSEGLLGKRHRKTSALVNFGVTAGYGAASWHNSTVR